MSPGKYKEPGCCAGPTLVMVVAKVFASTTRDCSNCAPPWLHLLSGATPKDSIQSHRRCSDSYATKRKCRDMGPRAADHFISPRSCIRRQKGSRNRRQGPNMKPPKTTTQKLMTPTASSSMPDLRRAEEHHRICGPARFQARGPTMVG